MADDKKIIVDDDWKKQAQQEKQKAQENLEQEKSQEQNLPKGDFASLVTMLSTQALYAMGLIGAPDDKNLPEKNLDLARYSIDMLGAVEEKTKGNLNDDEETLLEASLGQLRMAFIKVSQESGD